MPLVAGYARAVFREGMRGRFPVSGGLSGTVCFTVKRKERNREHYRIFREARRQAGQYRRGIEASAESWKPAHNLAMADLDFQEKLSYGMGLYEHFKRLDEAWRSSVLSREIPYDPKMHKAVRLLFEDWLAACQAVEERIRFFIKKGYVIDNAQMFRRYRAAAEWMLAPASAVFQTPAFSAARNEAVKAHRAGRTTED